MLIQKVVKTPFYTFQDKWLCRYENWSQTDEHTLFKFNSPAVTKPLVVAVIINDLPLSMEVDIGLAVTLGFRTYIQK